jgi:hypothetical protein
MLAPLAEVYVQRNFLAAVTRRLLPWLFVLAGSLVAVPAFADPKTEREAQALQKKAIEEDNLNVNYPAAIKKLQTAIGKCSGDRCGPPLRAALLRDLGAMQVLNGNSEDARSSFAQALAIEPTIELDPAYKNAQIEQVFSEVKKKGGPPAAPPPETPQGGGPPPAVPPTGDFATTPPTEALVRTPLALYAEYFGTEQIARVIAKYKGAGMAEWKPLELPKVGSGFGALIPCKDVGLGTIQYYIQGFNTANDPVATSGTRNKPFTVQVKQQIAGAPVGLPGQEVPKQCPETAGMECPPDFPGCNNRKGAGEECKKDLECASRSCVEGKCADKKGGGEKCESDEECASGSCADGTCTTPKKAEGEDCSTDDECEGSSCKEGKCGGGAGKRFSRLWIGAAASMDFFLMPGTTDVCLLDPSGKNPATSGNPYNCVDPSSGATFPADAATNMSIAKHGDLVQSGFAPGNLRLMVSIDYAVTSNVLVGVRGGYELFTDPASSPNAPGPAFAPIHAEARLTYLAGKDAIAQKVAPMVLLAAGVGEFDAFVQVPVFLTQPSGPPQQVPKNAWLTAGPGFAAAGGGIRVLVSKHAAFTGALKLEAAFGGSASLLFGAAPELGVQLGF